MSYLAGLETSAMVHLTNYFHFRPGFNVNEKTIAMRGESYEDSNDIFETLEAD